ncbi:fibronectin type III domain-containing protein [Lachnospiraceae bacterium MD1]|uniref:Fibronectin type III domain-containing protein n=1 Tax=Variimorphobacter saccharofermentans TaxID=2755051 RepID=A0A839JX61_9FIRM|nr:YDG domain-containing protein [Variimorphobacter saccharofermentans]MBB2181817.1 fibronectin type III domain-containing protein [Variimorphobacter saccharofermentans]
MEKNKKVERNGITMNKKKMKRLLAVVLSMLMMVSVIDYSGLQNVNAQTLNGTKTITAFAKLTEDIANQQLAVGVEESEIKLPDTLNVTIQDPMVEAPKTATGSAIGLGSDQAASKQVDMEQIISQEQTITGITWKINVENSGSTAFDSTNAGAVFIYEPILPEGYTLADGVSLPQIQVLMEDGGKWAFSQSQTIDGIEITVKADKDMFPEGAVLHAEKVTNAEDKEKIQNAVSEEVKSKETGKTVTELVSFDITITDADGKELQPDTSKGEVKVSFAKLSMTENEMIKGNHNIQVFHMNDTLSNAEKIESIVDNKGVVEAVAEHFSVYAITETTDTPDTDMMTTLYINKGNITIGDGTVSGFDASGTEVTTANSNGYIITRAETYSSVSRFTISVSGGTHNIILKDVELYLDPDISNSPFSIASGAKVNLVLEGTNYLQSRYDSTPAGLHVPEGAELVIAKGSTGSITALGGPGAGIGGNDGEAGGTITINGGTLTYVSGGTSGAGIGGGRGGAGGSITINGGTLTDVRSSYGAGVGGGKGGAGGNIIINGGTINTQSTDGAGIGGGEDGAGGSISINGGTVKATGSNGAGIGGGYQGDGGTITISNGEVTATSNYGAGIGGGAYGWYHTGGTITISGGTVTATTTNSEYGVGIGNGFRGGDNGGTLSSGGNSVYVIANSVTADTSSFNGIIENDGNTTVYGPYTLAGDMTIATGKTMTISSGSTLTVPSGKILTVNGTLINNGTLSLGAESCLTGTDGILSGEGTFKSMGDPTSDMIVVPTNLIYNGTDLEETAKSAISIDSTKVGTGMIFNHEFQITTNSVEGWVLSISPAEVKETGTYTATFTKDSKTISKEFTVTQSATTFDGGITVDKADKTYTYGDTITVTAKPKATGSSPVKKSFRSFSAPTANQMALFVGETQISDSVDGDSNGVYTMTYDTTDKALAIGSNTITAKYVESANMADYSGTVMVTLNQKPLTATRSGGSYIYDGTNSPIPGFDKNNGLTGVVGSDDVNVLVSGILPDANVGEGKVFTATGVTFRGTDAGYYSLAVDDVHMTIDVTPITVTPIPQNSTRNVVVGVGTFSESTFISDITNENITGTYEYDYNGKTNYADVVSELAKLSKDATAEVTFRFTTNGNYEGIITGTLSISVVGLEFAGKDKALTLKTSPIYGDKWSEIVSLDTSKLSANVGGNPVAGTYTLMIDGVPFNGVDIPKGGSYSYNLTFTATDNSFTNVEVMSGNVDVIQREAVLSWGDTEFTYNGSAQKPMVAITNKVAGDDVISSVADMEAQTNVGTGYTATAVLSGNSASNYKLPSVFTATFSITAATATGSVAVSGTDANSNKKLDSGDTVTADLSAVTPAGGTASYQWKKTTDGTTESIGTDQATYTLTSSDSKGKIFCEVTFTGNTTGTISSNKLDIAKEILTGNIAITGENTVGSVMTVSLPTNAGISGSDYEIQWYRDNAAIIGANAISYTIAKEDLGKTLKVVITAKEASEGFTGTLTSNVFTVPAMAPEKAVVSVSLGNRYIALNWTKPYANGSDITGYSLTVKQGEAEITGSPFAIGADATSYKVENLTNGTEYTFILSTINGEGSTVSDTVMAKPKKPSDGGSSGGGVSSGGSPTSTVTTMPAIKDASNQAGWEAIKEQIGQSREGDTVTIEMNGSSVVPGEVLDVIRGTETTLVFDMGEGITWSINGQSITEGSLKDVNLDVSLNTDAIPEGIISQMAGEQDSNTLSLAYDGPFGFTSVLTINLNKINAGKYGNLFYYNPVTKQLTLQAVEKIGEKGTVELPFSHASDYVVIISEEPMLEKTLDQIAISAVKGTLYVGGTEKKSMTLKLELPQLLKEAVEQDSSILKITYQSSNPKIATVNASGKITAKKAGKTTITTQVTINGVQRKFKTTITVKKAYIKLIKSTNTLKTGSTFTYKAIGYGVKTEDIMFYTSKKSIVVINKTTGKAKARTKGTDYIIVKVGKVIAKIKVKVS